MTRIGKSVVLIALCAAALCGIGLAIAGAHSHEKGEKPCPGCAQPCGDNAAAPMPDTMKAHLAEMKTAVAALRAGEAKLAGTEDPKAFRAAVLEHLRKIDDLQASHLAHMESMMGRMHGAKGGTDPCGCKCDCGKPGGGHGKTPNPPNPQNLRIQ